jgi:uncharacterized protein (TIGR02996 family)
VLAALYEAVYAAPDDDAPRHVLADALLERGDPRGELIALQLAATRDPRRERELLEHHAASWAGGVAAAGAVVFERGFPARVQLAAKPALNLRAPEWRTVRALDGLERVSKAKTLALCGVPSLRELGILAATWLDQLVPPARPWHALRMIGAMASESALAALPELRAFRATVTTGRREALRFEHASLAELDLLCAWPRRSTLALPPSLERLALHGVLGLPRFDLATVPGLRELRLGARTDPIVPRAIPDSVEHLAIETAPFPLPVFETTARSRLRSAKLVVGQVDAGSLAPLASIERLELAGYPAPGALAVLPALRALTLHTVPSFTPDGLGAALAQVPQLDELVLHLSDLATPARDELRALVAGTRVTRLAIRIGAGRDAQTSELLPPPPRGAA